MPATFIFIGLSGAGNGTQAALLMDYVREHEPDTPLFYIETGEQFREFIARDLYSSTLARAIMAGGERQPDFLAVWMWSRILVENMTGTEHVMFDGTPRSVTEAQALHSALDFYGYDKRYVIYLDVSEAVATERLKNRARSDDKKLSLIEKRFEWFRNDTVAALQYYDAHEQYTVLKINGDQPIETVHQDIVTYL